MDIDRGVLRVTHSYVADCFRVRTTPRVGELAERLQLSRTQTTRAIQRRTGKTASTYLKYLQIVRMCVLLDQGSTVTQAAYDAGFGTRASVFRVFRKFKHMTPAAYRRARTK